MENLIHNATNDFPFSNLILLKPTSLQGGNYFIKIRLNDSPVYIQTPKCTTKNGIIKAGKKYFSDLMFTNENENFIQWIEKLEDYCQKYIYEHRTEWFETDLEIHDIENSFASCCKLYKSGKYYIVRSHVPTQMGKSTLKIYNENEELVDLENITDKTNIITILEVQGIKCSVRSFQIEIEIKQMLVLSENNLFEKCILVKSKPSSTIQTEPNEYLGKSFENTLNKINETRETISINIPDYNTGDNIEYETSTITNAVENVAEEVNDEPEDPNELKEVDFSLEQIPETDQVQIKQRNDVYYKMYQDAKRKAKMARDLALSSYLEAKQIKNTYMLADLDDSDSDLEEDDFYDKSA